MNLGEFLQFKNCQTNNEKRIIHTVEMFEVEELITKIGKELNNLVINKQLPLNFPEVPNENDELKQKIIYLIVYKIWKTIITKDLFKFYTQENLQEIINNVCKNDYVNLMNLRNITNIDNVTDFALLGLYDLIFYVDDSPSMSVYDDPESKLFRFSTEKEVIKSCLFWNNSMNNNGIYIRFYNSILEGNNISSFNEIDELFKVPLNKRNPMEKNFKSKIIDELLFRRLYNCMFKPTIAITITDGKPDNNQNFIKSISECQQACLTSRYGIGSVEFVFAQIGKSDATVDWLMNLENNSNIDNIFVAYEYEFWKGIKNEDKTEEWMNNLLTGPIKKIRANKLLNYNSVNVNVPKQFLSNFQQPLEYQNQPIQNFQQPVPNYYKSPLLY